MAGKATILLVVACVLLRDDGCILLSKRPEGKKFSGLWEFPGGKIEKGESPELALVRELHEELGIFIDARDLTPLSFSSYAYQEFHLLMPLYLCSDWEGLPKGNDGQEIVWTEPKTLDNYAMPPADESLKTILLDRF